LESFFIERAEKNGGNILYKTYDEIVKDYISGALHPGDVKSAVARDLNRLIQPVRDHFANNEEARKLLTQVRQFKTTR